MESFETCLSPHPQTVPPGPARFKPVNALALPAVSLPVASAGSRRLTLIATIFPLLIKLYRPLAGNRQAWTDKPEIFSFCSSRG